jgi:DNA-binding transcriptional ArsR family regulator
MSAAENEVYRALADPTRRAMLRLLSERPRTVSELAEPFDMSQPNVSLHLATLRDAGLVRAEKAGRFRVYHVEPEPLKSVAAWLAELEQLWEERLDALGALLEEEPDEPARANKKAARKRAAKRARKASR